MLRVTLKKSMLNVEMEGVAVFIPEGSTGVVMEHDGGLTERQVVVEFPRVVLDNGTVRPYTVYCKPADLKLAKDQVRR